MTAYWHRSCSVCDKVKVVCKQRFDLVLRYHVIDDCLCRGSHLISRRIDIREGVLLVWNESEE